MAPRPSGTIPGLAIITIVLGTYFWTTDSLARPPPGGPTPEAGWFRGLRQPQTGASCCDEADCHRIPDSERRQRNGHWEFLATRKTFRSEADNAWHVIPETQWIPRSTNPTGALVVCSKQYFDGNDWRLVVLCAVKPFEV